VTHSHPFQNILKSGSLCCAFEGQYFSFPDLSDIKTFLKELLYKTGDEQPTVWFGSESVFITNEKLLKLMCIYGFVCVADL